MRLTGDQLVRAAALAAVLVVAVVVGVLLLRSPGGDYVVKARFQNAAQLVKGNLVQTGGAPVGKVKTIDLTPDGQAEVTMNISDDFAPLRRGTLATIRQASLLRTPSPRPAAASGTTCASSGRSARRATQSTASA